MDTYLSQLEKAAHVTLNPILDEVIDMVIRQASDNPDDVKSLFTNHQYQCSLNTDLLDWMDKFIKATQSQAAATIPYVLQHFWMRMRDDAQVNDLSQHAFTLLLRRVERVVIACGTAWLHQLYHQNAYKTMDKQLNLERHDSNNHSFYQVRLQDEDDFSFFISIYAAHAYKKPFPLALPRTPPKGQNFFSRMMEDIRRKLSFRQADCQVTVERIKP